MKRSETEYQQSNYHRLASHVCVVLAGDFSCLRMDDLIAVLGLGALITAAIMFTTGFLWDRVRRSREER